MGRWTLDAAPADLALQVVANYTLGQSYYSLGDFRRAQDLFRLNVSMLTDELRYARFGMATIPAVTSRMYLVYGATQLGEFTAGIAQGESSIQLAQAVADPLSLIFVQRSLGHLYLDRGDVHRAMPLLERSLELCQHRQIRDGLPTHLALLGYAHALSGNMTEASSLLEQAVADSAVMRTMYGHAMRCARLGADYRLAGRPVEARTQAERALQFAQTHQERGAQAWILHLCRDLARHDTPSQAEPAATYYQQAQTLAETLGMRPLQAHCAFGLGLLHGQTGQASQARLALTTAIALYQAMGMSFSRSQAETALAQVGMSTERPA
jgi:tetratricopeptide (TPR) repeat protein